MTLSSPAVFSCNVYWPSFSYTKLLDHSEFLESSLKQQPIESHHLPYKNCFGKNFNSYTFYQMLLQIYHILIIHGRIKLFFFF